MSKNIKQSACERLFSNNIAYDTIKKGKSIWKGVDSEWSKCIIGNSPLDAIASAFAIIGKDKDALGNGYNMAISGTGKEGGENSTHTPKILTLHSSSLLSLLCFFEVNNNHPIIIDDVEYSRVLFEVQNDVFVPSNAQFKPSNVDVALVSYKNNTPVKILFLESKFTEYLSHGHSDALADRYKSFYDKYRPTLDKDGFQACKINKNYCLNKGMRTNVYLNGIKQAFSHIIGLATGPKRKQFNRGYIDLFSQVAEVEFATILFNCDDKEFKSYQGLYEQTFSKEKIERIKEALKESSKSVTTDYIERMRIRPQVLTYQEVFSEQNPNYPLPEKVRQFYKL